MNDLSHIIAVARGQKKADLLLKGASVVNVFSGELERADVALAEGKIAGIGRYDAARTIDLSSRILVPGFIDSHVHIESSMLSPAEFCRAILPFGTTAVIADPHEIANVLGSRGIRFMLDTTEHLPLDFYFMLPSCVPASALETSGARLAAKDLVRFLKHPRVLGLAEMMDYPGVLAGKRDVLAKLEAFGDRMIDGHAPGLTGRDLSAYRAAGITSDHESAAAEEAREKIRRGMTVFVREGSAARNLEDLLPAITPANSAFFCFASDDREAEDLTQGGISSMLRKAVRLGLDPVTAIRMATINPARHFNLRNKGAVAPGYDADLVVIDTLRDFRVGQVFKEGVPVAKKGRVLVPVSSPPEAKRFSDSVRCAPVSAEDLRLRSGTGRARVIELIPGSIETRARIMPVIVDNGSVANGPDRDIAKLIVVERHKRSGRTGLGLVRGFGLTHGAFASTVAHDSHNIIAVGVSDEDIIAAVRGLAAMHGGMIAVRNRKVLARLPLPLAGLMSAEGVGRVARAQAALDRAVRRLGVRIRFPFAALSFLALPVIPELKLTDRGLVDVSRFKLVDLFL